MPLYVPPPASWTQISPWIAVVTFWTTTTPWSATGVYIAGGAIRSWRIVVESRAASIAAPSADASLPAAGRGIAG